MVPISRIKEDFSNYWQNATNSTGTEKIACIWDADRNGIFSKTDVSQYIKKYHPTIKEEQTNHIFSELKNLFDKKIKYTQENLRTLTLNLDKIIKKYKKPSKTDMQQAYSDFIEHMNKEKKNTPIIIAWAKLKGYDPDLTIKNSQIKNNYYTGGLYDIQFDGLKVTVTNLKPKKGHRKEHTINLYVMLQGMNKAEIVNFLLFIQRQPGEILEDLAIEMDDIASPTGQDMHTSSNPDFVAGGYYSPGTDQIVTSPQHLIHELGHAVDYSGQVNMSASAQSRDFKDMFRIELNEYIKAGNKRFNIDDKTTWMPEGDKYNYCTLNEQEMFAESYKLAMTGKCRSQGVITKYFPKTLDIAIALIKQTREKSDLDRRYTAGRAFTELLSQITLSTLK